MRDSPSPPASAVTTHFHHLHYQHLTPSRPLPSKIQNPKSLPLRALRVSAFQSSSPRPSRLRKNIPPPPHFLLPKSSDSVRVPLFGNNAVQNTTTEAPITTHADALLKLLEDNPKPVAEGGDTPAQLAAKAALRAKFVAYEMPANFVTDLRADRDALTRCNDAKHSDNQEGLDSTASIDDLLAQAQACITRLDAAIKNKYARDPGTLSAWAGASRIERAPKKTPPPEDPAPPAPAP